MIVSTSRHSRLLITQPDHAALAARIMRHWRADGLADAPRRTSILLAIEEHDNGWRDVDVAPLVDEATGRILDFTEAPAHIRRDIWPRAVERLAPTPYAAALVAQHAVHIYRRYRHDPDWAAFFSRLEEHRDALLSQASVTLENLVRDYGFVRIGDLVSLTFCSRWTDVQTDDAGSGHTIRLDGSRLVVAPDPFEGREVPIEVAARELPNRAFHSTDDAHRAFSAALVVSVTGIAVGGSR